MATDYEKAHNEYRKAAKAAASGDQEAKSAKIGLINDIRKIERDAARAGTILSAQYRGEKVEVTQTQTHSKRSLQEEYVRKFEGKGGEAPKVMIDGKETTLAEHHRKRFFGK